MRLEAKDLAGIVLVAGTIGVLAIHGNEGHQDSHLPFEANAGGASTSARAVGTIAFVDVNVLPLTDDRVLRRQVVLVEDGRVTRIGPIGLLEVPEDAITIEGQGQRYLLPGLVDAHVHLPRASTDAFPLFLANGVTTVFNLSGGSPHLALREGSSAPDVAGPSILTSGPFVSEENAPDAEEARAVVRQQAADGYDMLKLHGRISEEAYAALIDEAETLGLVVVGHAPRNLPVSSLLEHGQRGVAHAEELIYTHLTGLDADRARSLAERIATAGIWVTPTMTTFRSITEQWGHPEGLEARLARPEARFLPPSIRTAWVEENVYIGRPEEERGRIESMNDFHRPLVDALHDAGVRLLVGTDTPLPGLAPGFSLHDELDELASAGLTNTELLHAATSDAGDFVRDEVDSESTLGWIVQGGVADMLLLDSDPRSDRSTLRTPIGVMVRGTWYSRADLDELLRRATQPAVAAAAGR
jgi:imidazolonepropionase-like amidohydrolase